MDLIFKRVVCVIGCIFCFVLIGVIICSEKEYDIPPVFKVEEIEQNVVQPEKDIDKQPIINDGIPEQLREVISPTDKDRECFQRAQDLTFDNTVMPTADLIELLKQEGFTDEQIDYAIQKLDEF